MCEWGGAAGQVMPWGWRESINFVQLVISGLSQHNRASKPISLYVHLLNVSRRSKTKPQQTVLIREDRYFSIWYRLWGYNIMTGDSSPNFHHGY